MFCKTLLDFSKERVNIENPLSLSVGKNFLEAACLHPLWHLIL